MNIKGPIVIIDDDIEDLDIYQEMLAKLKLENEIQVFSTASAALEYLRSSIKPFLVLSDVNLPMQNGFELRERISQEPTLHEKCIPYIFITTDASPSAIRKAYMLSVQGIFQKPSTVQEWEKMLSEIVTYWSRCLS